MKRDLAKGRVCVCVCVCVCVFLGLDITPVQYPAKACNRPADPLEDRVYLAVKWLVCTMVQYQQGAIMIVPPTEHKSKS